MVLRLISATEIKSGTTILVDNEAYTARSNDISKTGKHGASKCRIEAISIFTGKKKIVAVPGDTRFEVPNIDKRKAQVLNVGEGTASIMDLESFETIDLDCPEEIKNELSENSSVEYWDIEGRKVVKRKI